MKKIFKKLSAVLVISIMLLSMSSVYAAPIKPEVSDKLTKQTDILSDSAGFNLGSGGVGSLVATIIKGALSLLGVVFIILIVLAGYRWMMASGNDEAITKSKGTIKHAIIGLAIVLAAYTITDFVFYEFDWIYRGTPAGDGGGGSFDFDDPNNPDFN